MTNSKKSDDVLDEKSAAWTQEVVTPGKLSKAVAVVLFLLPSFFSKPFQRFVLRSKSGVEPQASLNATSYLDGLRGMAALIVYMFHYSYRWYGRLGHGWGSDEADHWFLQLPIIRVIHSGRASVTTFFVISGFVLTVRPLTLLHRGQPDRLFDALGGALFRRPFRLFLPITASTGIIATLCQLNVFNRHSAPPTSANTPGDQFRHWLGSLVGLWNPFGAINGRKTRYGNPYDGNLWTIPVEFKGSVLVFLLLLALLRARCWIRLMAVAVSTCWLVHREDFDMGLFTGGLFLAELSITIPPARSRAAPTGRWGRLLALVTRREENARLMHLLKHAATIGCFFVSLWLTGYPQDNGQKSPWYRTLSKITPTVFAANEETKQFFWLGCGSLLLFASLMYSPPLRMATPSDGMSPDGNPYSSQATSLLGQSPVSDEDQGFNPAAQPLLQRPFTTRFVQYLGRHSYSLYLAHDSVNRVVCNSYLGPANAAFSRAEAAHKQLVAEGNRMAEADALMEAAQWAYWRTFLLATFMNTLVLFCVSDLFTRAVDVNCVKMARRFQRWAWGRS
ncbi:hypothetical protein RB595_002106 [Gaeumannomyces hyphopodioides]